MHKDIIPDSTIIVRGWSQCIGKGEAECMLGGSQNERKPRKWNCRKPTCKASMRSRQLGRLPGVDRTMLKLMGKDPDQPEELLEDVLARTSDHTIDWRQGEVALFCPRRGSRI